MEFNELWEKVKGIIQMIEIEAQLLYDSASDGIIVELGTLHGGSAFILASKGGKVTSIDKEPILRVIADHIKFITGESIEISKVWNQKIDVLFIDSDHSYDSVREDILAWVPHVVEGGKILFHDYDSWVGVTKAVHEAIENKIISPIEKRGCLLLTTK